MQAIDKNLQIFEKVPYDLLPLDPIRALLKKNQTNFVDIEFVPAECSICDPTHGKPFKEQIVWKRPKEFMEVDPARGLMNPSVFFQKIEPSDIKQGQLGDCWFMSALASLAEMPHLVERLFATQKYSEEGLYRVRICKNGSWNEVIVDDYFPCKEKGGPIFSRANGNELWVLLLEKAYAKVHGNYFTLRGGFANEGMIDLTGCPTECFDFEDEVVQEGIQSGDFFHKIKDFDDAGYLISASTPGEDKYTENGGPEETSGLVPGHAYSVIQAKEVYGNQLLQIRNPWGAFEWNGDWGDNSDLWTPQIQEALKYVAAADDGTFWMNFKDFSENFKALNVCKVFDYQEVRIKGEFTNQLCQDLDTQIRSKFYYELKVEKRQRLMIGLHQEDERIQNVVKRRPYMALGLVILKKIEDEDAFEFSYLKEFQAERQTELDIELEEGDYIILPRTSGCTLRRPLNAPSEFIKLIDSNGDLHPLVELTVKDIFNRLDSVEVNRALDYSEFVEFYEKLGIEFEEAEYRQKVLKNFCSSDKNQVNLRGFLDFFKQQIREQDDVTIWRWFERWGYDKDLYPVEARTFMMTIHSKEAIALTINEVPLKRDFDEIANKLILQNFGEILEQKQGIYKLLFKFHEQSYTFSFGVENVSEGPLQITVDCNSSRNMLFSEEGGKVTRVLEPGALEFMMHAEAAPGAEEFARGVVCSYKEVR